MLLQTLRTRDPDKLAKGFRRGELHAATHYSRTISRKSSSVARLRHFMMICPLAETEALSIVARRPVYLSLLYREGRSRSATS
jgi:hypothetical protein